MTVPRCLTPGDGAVSHEVRGFGVSVICRETRGTNDSHFSPLVSMIVHTSSGQFVFEKFLSLKINLLQEIFLDKFWIDWHRHSISETFREMKYLWKCETKTTWVLTITAFSHVSDTHTKSPLILWQICSFSVHKFCCFFGGVFCSKIP